jgi:hypothetical protein
MSNTDTGGPAFPSPRWEGWGSPQEGMTVRDYFAAKAMQAGINTYHHDEEDLDEFCRWAYVVADEMLKARDAKD